MQKSLELNRIIHFIKLKTTYKPQHQYEIYSKANLSIISPNAERSIYRAHDLSPIFDKEQRIATSINSTIIRKTRRTGSNNTNKLHKIWGQTIRMIELSQASIRYLNLLFICISLQFCKAKFSIYGKSIIKYIIKNTHTHTHKNFIFSTQLLEI